MSITRVYLAVEKDRADHAIGMLKSSVWSAERLENSKFGTAPSECVLLVTVNHPSSRSGARNRHYQIRRTLATLGIDFRLLAVDPGNPPIETPNTWHVVLKREYAGPLRRFISAPIGSHGSALDRAFAPFVLGARQLVVGSNSSEAELRRKELHLQRGEPTDRTRVLRRLDGGLPRPANALPPPPFGRLGVGLWLVCWLPLVGLLFWLIRYGNDPLWVGVAYAAWVVLGVAIRFKRALPDAKERFNAIIGPLLAGSVLALLGVWAHQLVATYPEGMNFFAILILIPVGLGLSIQMKRWRLASRVSSLAPIAISVGAFLTPLWGYLTYGVYLQAAGLSFTSVQTSTLEQAWAGSGSLSTWLGIILFLVAICGIAQWVIGDESSGLGLLASIAALAVFVAVLGSTFQDAVESGQARIEGVPRGWYAIAPYPACLFASVPSDPLIEEVLPSYGPSIDTGQAQIIVGTTEQNEWVVLSRDNDYDWLIPTNRVRVEPVQSLLTSCR
jgi:hypothetical protein